MPTSFLPRRPAALLALAALLCTILPATAVRAADPADHTEQAEQSDDGTVVAGEWLVTHAGDLPAPSALVRAAFAVRDVTTLTPDVALLRGPADRGRAAAAANALGTDVIAVEPNVERRWHRAPEDPSYGLQWAHQTTGIEAAWDTHTGGGQPGESRPLVAVLDSGADATHPDLAGTVVASLRSAGDQVVPGEPVNDGCDIGHGSLVTGVIGAQGNNGVGISGTLWAPRIIDIALTSPLNDCPGGPRDSDSIAALHHLAQLDEPPLVATMSFGTNTDVCPAAYQAAIDAARAAGIVLTSSAGNGGSTRTSVPASCNGVIAVSATGPDLQKATYAQHNAAIDLTAPGGQVSGTQCPEDLADVAADMILSTSLREATTYAFTLNCSPEIADPNGHRLEARQGTSFSTPYVAGVIALLRQQAIDQGTPLDVDQAEALVEGTARDLGIEGRDVEHGWGMVDPAAAMAALVAGQVPPLQADPDFPVETLPEAARVADPGTPGVTDPIRQAVATSALLPTGSAPLAVVARADDFADALAGSALGRGLGPLLLTGREGPLAAETRAELQRVLDTTSGTPTVYVMGGTAAVPAGVDAELEALGADVVRLAGTGREHTAALTAREVEALAATTPDLPTRDAAILVSGRDFADAVSAGQMAAHYGMPVLVTNPEQLHPVTEAELARIAPARVWVVGGEAAVSPATQAQVEALGPIVARLAGPTRIDTAIAVWEQYTHELAVDGNGSLDTARTLLVNLRQHFGDALAATVLAGQGDWFMPVDGSDVSVLPETVVQAYCGLEGDLLVMGGTDRISDTTAAEALQVLAGEGC